MDLSCSWWQDGYKGEPPTTEEEQRGRHVCRGGNQPPEGGSLAEHVLWVT